MQRITVVFGAADLSSSTALGSAGLVMGWITCDAGISPSTVFQSFAGEVGTPDVWNTSTGYSGDFHLPLPQSHPLCASCVTYMPERAWKSELPLRKRTQVFQGLKCFEKSGRNQLQHPSHIAAAWPLG